MSGYAPRRGPNMNQYIANLNTIPAAGEQAPADGFANLEDELSLFTNVEFLNEFDLGDSVDGQGDGLSAATSRNGDAGFEEGFNFQYITPDVGSMPAFGPGQAGAANSADFGVPYLGHRPGQYPQQQPPATPTAPTTGEKRAASSTPTASPPSDSNAALDVASRAAAEEDKRRRNTAASARFRVKKKQREQALERTAKDMTDRAEKLEARIAELEQENKFLRSLVVEKAGGGEGKEHEMAHVLRKVAADARKAGSAKKGVGTDSE